MDADFWCLAPYNAKIRKNFKIEGKNQNLLETKDDQVLYYYKNIWVQNYSPGILAKKIYMTNISWIVHGYWHADFVFST
jgi:hypothetical protein